MRPFKVSWPSFFFPVSLSSGVITSREVWWGGWCTEWFKFPLSSPPPPNGNRFAPQAAQESIIAMMSAAPIRCLAPLQSKEVLIRSAFKQSCEVLVMTSYDIQHHKRNNLPTTHPHHREKGSALFCGFSDEEIAFSQRNDWLSCRSDPLLLTSY